MRILYHALVELDLPNGHAIHTRELCEGLAAAGHTVTLVAPPSGYRPETPGLELVSVPFLGFSALRLRAYRFLAARRGRALIQSRRPDVIIDKGTPALGELARLATRAHLPLVVELNGTLDDPRDPFHRQTRAAARRAGAHSPLAFLSVSPGLGASWEDLCGRSPISREIFENGANVGLFPADGEVYPRARLAVERDAFLVGYVGSDNPAYDFDSVFAGLRIGVAAGLDLRFLVVGPESLRKRTRVLAGAHELGDRLIARPPVPYPEVAPLLRACDAGIVILGSEHGHMAPTAMKLKECLLVGTPVICNLPAAWNGWSLTSAVWGLDPVSPEGIATALEKIAENRDAARARARRGGDIVRKRYSWTEAARTYGRRLEELTGEPSGMEKPRVDLVKVP